MAVVTITIASPAVISWTAHGLVANRGVAFKTSGALPTGLSVNTEYYVKYIDADTFNVSSTVGGTNINTSGTQSGTQECVASDGIFSDNKAIAVTVTNGANAEITWTNHDFEVNDLVFFLSPTGTMPGGINSGQIYYVQAIVNANTFRISTTRNGSALTTTSTGTNVTGIRSVTIEAGNQAVTLSNSPLSSNIEITNIVSNSNWRIAQDADNTEIGSGTSTTGTVKVQTKYKGLIRVDVRKSSSGTRYLPFTTYANTTNGDVSVYVSQVIDTIV